MRMGPTDQRLETIRYGIGEYYRIWGRLPCPGNLNAAPGAAGYDAETRNGTNVCTSGINVGGATGIYIGSVPVQDLAAAMDCLSGTQRATYVGNLPVDAQNILQRNLTRMRDAAKGNAEKYAIQKQNCVTVDMLLDEYDNKIVYAVSQITTRIATMDPALDLNANPADDMGKIIIRDNVGQALSSKGQWFVLASLGKDGKGAHDRFGNVGIPCTAQPGFDQENCDHANNIFRSMPVALTNDANHFDDEVDYSLDNALSEHSFWYWKDLNEDGQRDLTFQPNTRIVIDTPATVGANDKVVLGAGNLAIKQDAGGGGNIEVQGTDKGFYSPKFCYDTGSSCPP